MADAKHEVAGDSKAGGVRKHVGSCHCGSVRFEVEIDATSGSRCNCTICTKVGPTGSIVKPAAFKLLAGAESLSTYEWGSKMSRRFFCKQCGVHCYGSGHLAQLGGDFVSVNLNCLDGVELSQMKVSYWDGRHNNWQAGVRSTPWPIGRRADSTPALSPSESIVVAEEASVAQA